MFNAAASQAPFSLGLRWTEGDVVTLQWLVKTYDWTTSNYTAQVRKVPRSSDSPETILPLDALKLIQPVFRFNRKEILALHLHSDFKLIHPGHFILGASWLVEEQGPLVLFRQGN